MTTQQRNVLRNALCDLPQFQTAQGRQSFIGTVFGDTDRRDEFDRALRFLDWQGSSIVVADNLLRLLEGYALETGVSAVEYLIKGIEPYVAAEKRANLRALVLAQSIAAVAQTDKRHNIFICHAHEDKEAVVRPLAEALRRKKLNVWCDDLEFRMGDSVGQNLEDAMRDCDFALIVLSPNFFKKGLLRGELDALAARERQQGTPRLLPVWHDINAAEVRSLSPVLADRLALETDQGFDRIATEVNRAVRGEDKSRKARCALLFPFTHDAAQLQSISNQALERIGVDVIGLPDLDVRRGARWLDDLRDAIQLADFVVADVTDSNPNILIEVGLALAFAKPLILLADSRSNSRIPSDLVGYHCLSYDLNRKERLSADLERVARRHADSTGAR